MLRITEKELQASGYRLELWNGGTVRRWIKESSPDSFLYVYIEQEWVGGPFIPALYVGRFGGSAIKLAGLDSLEEVDHLYQLATKGTSITTRQLWDSLGEGDT